jgi:NifU-like protein involved in Fe-S cluster formation
MKYNALTRRYFESPSGAGVLSGPGLSRGAAGSVEIGTWVQFDLRVHLHTLQAARFLAFGCPHTIAVAAWLAEQAPGQVLRPALPESVHALSARFEVPIPKLGRLLIVEDAWIAAARDALGRVKEA